MMNPVLKSCVVFVSVVLLATCLPLAAQTQQDTETDNMEICPQAQSQLQINLCVATALDEQNEELKRLVNEVDVTNRSVDIQASTAKFITFRDSFCDSYKKVYKGHAMAIGSTGFCRYDLNAVYMDQLRWLRSQARGREKGIVGK